MSRNPSDRPLRRSRAPCPASAQGGRRRKRPSSPRMVCPSSGKRTRTKLPWLAPASSPRVRTCRRNASRSRVTTRSRGSRSPSAANEWLRVQRCHSATGHPRIAPSSQGISHRNSPAKNRPDPTSESEKQQIVSRIQSNYVRFGSGVVVLDAGISLQNRAAGFTLEPKHRNEAAGGKRPGHTIIPGFLNRGGVAVDSFEGMGGEMQSQSHLQAVSSMVDYGLNPQSALDAPRWQVTPEEVAAESFNDEPTIQPRRRSADPRRQARRETQRQCRVTRRSPPAVLHPATMSPRTEEKRSRRWPG